MLTFFAIDLFATIPLFLAHEWLYWLRFIRFLYLDSAATELVAFAINKGLRKLIDLKEAMLSAITKFAKFTMILWIMLHVAACMWVSLGREPNSWISQKAWLLQDKSEGGIYLAAIYWAMTTFAGIGYGDFEGFNTLDYVFTMAVYVRIW